MSYETLSDEDKIITAIGFVARGVELPVQLRQFLEEENLYEAITNPLEVNIDPTDRDSAGRHESCLS